MAIQCALCGITLPRDDAQFCNNCGTPVSPPSSRRPPVLREQIAQLPPSQPAHQSTHASPPAELRKPASDVPDPLPNAGGMDASNNFSGEKNEQFRPSAARGQARNTIAFEPSSTSSIENGDAGPAKMKQEQPQALPDVERKGLLSQAAEVRKRQQGKSAGDVERTQRPQPSFKWPAPITHTAGPAPVPQKEEGMGAPQQEDFPVSNRLRPQPNPVTPFINVWERDDMLAFATPKPPSQSEEAAIENIPTRQLENPIDTSSLQMSAPTRNDSPVEMLDTVPVLPQQAKPGNPPSLVPQTPPLPEMHGSNPTYNQYGPENHAVGAHRNDGRRQFMQGLKATVSSPLASAPGPMAARSLMRTVRKPLPLIAGAVALVVILGVLGTWIVVAQPFSVSPVTQPWQSFSDKSLGFSLLYPNSDWGVKIDRAQSTAHFHDSSNTAQVNVMATSAATSDLPQYLSQQAKHLGLSSAKAGAPISFAGASWQQIQGSTQQSGANYRGTILATVHNNRLYTITQLAPLSNYADQETVIFSPMRQSLRFV